MRVQDECRGSRLEHKLDCGQADNRDVEPHVLVGLLTLITVRSFRPVSSPGAADDFVRSFHRLDGTTALSRTMIVCPISHQAILCRLASRTLRPAIRGPEVPWRVSFPLERVWADQEEESTSSIPSSASAWATPLISASVFFCLQSGSMRQHSEIRQR